MNVLSQTDVLIVYLSANNENHLYYIHKIFSYTIYIILTTFQLYSSVTLGPSTVSPEIYCHVFAECIPKYKRNVNSLAVTL